MFCSYRISTNNASRGPSAIAELLVSIGRHNALLTSSRSGPHPSVRMATVTSSSTITNGALSIRNSSQTLCPKVLCYSFFPRDDMLAWYMPSSCVCLSVWLSNILRYCIKAAKHMITQTKPHDSEGTLVFWCQRTRRNSTEITPLRGRQTQVG